jgi:hypothetical protein
LKKYHYWKTPSNLGIEVENNEGFQVYRKNKVSDLGFYLMLKNGMAGRSARFGYQ